MSRLVTLNQETGVVGRRVGVENPPIHSKIVSEGDLPGVCHQSTGSSSGSWLSSTRNGEGQC